jgi:Protein of unknown function (DUF3617)
MWSSNRPVSSWPAATALLVLAVFGVTPPQAAANGIAPGEWKLTETITMNGSRMAPRLLRRCLSPEQAGDTAAMFSPTVNSGCERVGFDSSATSLQWHMRCTGQMDMDVRGEFVFDTPNHYTATIVSKGSMAGREVVNTSVAIEGEHAGDCR